MHTSRAQEGLRERLEERIAAPRREGRPEQGRRVALNGEGAFIIRIPKIHLDMVVVEGTDTDSLKNGPGRYENSAYPWDPGGKVGVAGHRTTYGAPFWDLEKMQEGDVIRLLTEYGPYRYEVTQVREILPHEGWVLDPTDEPTLVLTTCHPRYSAARRLVVFADRVGGTPVEDAAAA
ncbi:MAG: class E sortase [Actinomycetota bacterium]|nr:class E sortase [Actinomycetota bacterium]